MATEKSTVFSKSLAKRLNKLKLGETTFDYASIE